MRYDLLAAAKAAYDAITDYAPQSQPDHKPERIDAEHPIHLAICRLEKLLPGNKLPPKARPIWRRLLAASRANDAQAFDEADELAEWLQATWPAESGHALATSDALTRRKQAGAIKRTKPKGQTRSDFYPEPLRELAADIAREAAEQIAEQQAETEKRQAINAMDEVAQQAYCFANIQAADWQAWECLIVKFAETSEAAGSTAALEEAITHFGGSINKAERYAAALTRLAIEHPRAGHIANALSLASEQGFLPAVRDAIEGICERATAPRRGFAKHANSQVAPPPTVDEFVAASESLERVLVDVIGAPIVAESAQISAHSAELFARDEGRAKVIRDTLRAEKETIRNALAASERWLERYAGVIDRAEIVLAGLRDGPDAVFWLGSDAYTSAHAAARFIVQESYTGAWGWLESEGSPLEFPRRKIDLQRIEGRWDALLQFLNGIFLGKKSRRDTEALRAVMRNERIDARKRFALITAETNGQSPVAKAIPVGWDGTLDTLPHAKLFGFLVDKIVLGPTPAHGNRFEIWSADCKAVPGTAPTICPQADRKPQLKWLPLIEKRFRELKLVGEGETIHWVGSQSKPGYVCGCKFPIADDRTSIANGGQADRETPQGSDQGKGVAAKRPTSKRGRPSDSDVAADRKLFDAWKTGRYSNYAELEREFRLSAGDARRAIDRHRKRERLANE